MNELITSENGILVNPSWTVSSPEKAFGEYTDSNAHFDTKSIENAVKKVLSMTLMKRQALGHASRRMFLEGFYSFFNKTQTLAKPLLLSAKSYDPVPYFPNISPSLHLEMSLVWFPTKWFRSDYTALTGNVNLENAADRWIFMWPNFAPVTTDSDTIMNFYQGHVVSGRIIRDIGSPTGEVGIRFFRDSCMRIAFTQEKDGFWEKRELMSSQTDMTHNAFYSSIAFAVRFKALQKRFSVPRKYSLFEIYY
jgi:hypothetical protein